MGLKRICASLNSHLTCEMAIIYPCEFVACLLRAPSVWTLHCVRATKIGILHRLQGYTICNFYVTTVLTHAMAERGARTSGENFVEGVLLVFVSSTKRLRSPVLRRNRTQSHLRAAQSATFWILCPLCHHWSRTSSARS